MKPNTTIIKKTIKLLFIAMFMSTNLFGNNNCITNNNILNISIGTNDFIATETIVADSDEINNKPGADASHKGGMEPLFFVILSLLIGAATRHVFKKSFIPYTVLLLIFGLAIGVMSRAGLFSNFIQTLDVSIKWAGNIDPHLILFVFLPTLVFEAAFAMDIHTFKKTAVNATILAIPGIIIALFLTGALIIGLKYAGIGFAGWSWSIALMFGAVASATDPVAVVSLLKGLGASKKLGTLIEGESLLNDGTAIVFFMVFFLGLTGAAADVSPVSDFFRVSAGGILLGIIIGAVTIAWVKKVFNDALVEISVIIAAAYITFYIAEDFMHVSGVLGLVAFGLAMASVGKTRISPAVEHFLHEFWELVAFIANTLIFIIVGVVVAQRANFNISNLLSILIIYVGIHIVRAIVIAIFYPAMKRFGYGLSIKDSIVLWWGALRGAIALALALVVTAVDPKYIPAEISSQFLTIIAGIVTLTLVVNATSIGWLVNKLGLTKIKPARALMIYNANNYLLTSSQNALERLKADKYLKTANWNAVSEFLPAMPLDSNLKNLKIDTLSETRSRILEKEKSSYWAQFKEGLIGPRAVQYLTDAINEGLDSGGTRDLADRNDIETLWKIPRFFEKLQNSKILGKLARKWFFERMWVSYDTARGLLEAQEESLKLIESMYRHLNPDDNNTEENNNLIKVEKEIKKNIVYAQSFIRTIRKNFPDIYNSIATRHAIRTVLNYEARTVERLQKNGRISTKEANKMTESIEERLKKLVYSSLKVEMPKINVFLRSVPWLKTISHETFDKIADMFQYQVFSMGEHLIKEGTPADSIYIIYSGTVQVSQKGNIARTRGAGESIGVSNILTNSINAFTVTTDSPVTALRIKYIKLQRLFAESKELHESLWDSAARNIAIQVIQSHTEYSKMSDKHIKNLLDMGISYTLKKDQEINTDKLIVVLLDGECYVNNQSAETIKAPAVIQTNTKMATNGRLMVCVLK